MVLIICFRPLLIQRFSSTSFCPQLSSVLATALRGQGLKFLIMFHYQSICLFIILLCVILLMLQVSCLTHSVSVCLCACVCLCSLYGRHCVTCITVSETLLQKPWCHLHICLSWNNCICICCWVSLCPYFYVPGILYNPQIKIVLFLVNSTYALVLLLNQYVVFISHSFLVVVELGLYVSKAQN